MMGRIIRLLLPMFISIYLTNACGAEERVGERVLMNFTQKLVAHRGANNEVSGNRDEKYPENTHWSLTEALEQGVHYIELDTIKLQDDTFIVFHDSNLKRLGRYNPDIATTLTPEYFNAIRRKPINNLDYQTISQVDVGSYADYLNNRFRGTQVSLLEDYFKKISGTSACLVIELKADSPSIIPHLQKLVSESIKKYHLQTNQLIFISFDLDLIIVSKQALSKHKHLLLTTYSPSWHKNLYHRIKNLNDLNSMINIVKQNNLDGLDVECSALINQEFITRIHDHGLLCAVWNYPEVHDNFATMHYLLKLGVDMINTNQPAFMKRELEKVS